MQTRDNSAELADLLSRLTPSEACTHEGEDGAPELLLFLRVDGDIDGQRWRRLESRCPLWHERIGSVLVEFCDAVLHPACTWVVACSRVANGEGLEPKGAGPAVKVMFTFVLADANIPAPAVLPPVSTITFSLIRGDGTVVHKPTTRRVMVVNVPSAEREGC